MRRLLAVVMVVIVAVVGLSVCRDGDVPAPPPRTGLQSDEAPRDARVPREPVRSASSATTADETGESTASAEAVAATTSESEATGSIHGRVVGPDGRAVRATVHVLAAPDPTHMEPRQRPRDSKWLCDVETDEQGAFRIEDLPLQTAIVVSASGPDELRSTERHAATLTQAEPESRIDLELGAAGSLTVRFPEGIRDTAWPTLVGGISAYRGTRMTPDGGYLFAPLAPGEYVLRVTQREVGVQWIWLHIAPGEDRDLTLEPRSGSSLHGVVVDDLGDPIPDFSLYAERNTPHPTEPSWGFATTNEKGEFEFTCLAAVPHRLTSYNAEYTSIEPMVVRVPGPRLRLHVKRLASIRATLEVAGSTETPEQIVVSTRGAGAEWATPLVLPFRRDFEMRDVPVGEARVWLRAGDAAYVERVVHARPGEVVDLGAIVFQRARTVRGQVLAPNGAPVEGATVVAEPDSQAGLLLGETETDAQGEFELSGLPAKPTLGVTAEGFLETVRTAATDTPWIVTLSRGAHIHGYAHGEDGLRLPLATVRAVRTDAPGELETDCDGLGRYEFRVPPGTYRLTWDGRHPVERSPVKCGPSEPVEPAEGDVVELDLR